MEVYSVTKLEKIVKKPPLQHFLSIADVFVDTIIEFDYN
jgi:hypothetical protein